MPGRALAAQEPLARHGAAKARLLAAEQEKQQSAQAQSRKLQVGSGDRSERIRTYNFPQGRVTDHRINLTLYKLADVMNGELDELIDALQQEYQAEQLAAEEVSAAIAAVGLWSSTASPESTWRSQSPGPARAPSLSSSTGTSARFSPSRGSSSRR